MLSGVHVFVVHPNSQWDIRCIHVHISSLNEKMTQHTNDEAQRGIGGAAGAAREQVPNGIARFETNERAVLPPDDRSPLRIYEPLLEDVVEDILEIVKVTAVDELSSHLFVGARRLVVGDPEFRRATNPSGWNTASWGGWRAVNWSDLRAVGLGDRSAVSWMGRSAVIWNRHIRVESGESRRWGVRKRGESGERYLRRIYDEKSQYDVMQKQSVSWCIFYSQVEVVTCHCQARLESLQLIFSPSKTQRDRHERDNSLACDQSSQWPETGQAERERTQLPMISMSGIV
jgi:hypothetical protein